VRIDSRADGALFGFNISFLTEYPPSVARGKIKKKAEQKGGGDGGTGAGGRKMWKLRLRRVRDDEEGE
jgi:hypothetical protein